MAIWKFVLLMSLVFSFAAGARAEGAEEIDDQPLVDFINQHVLELERPVYVWNWFSSRGRNPLWASKFQSDDFATWWRFQNGARAYFENFCATDGTPNPPDCSGTPVGHGSGNMLGPGLYAATDPVSTANYGGGTGWAVMQIRLPKGFRYIRDNLAYNAVISAEGQKVLQAFGCSGFTNLHDVLHAARFRNWGRGGSGCLLAIREVLKDKVKLDGLSYYYGATAFPECSKKVGVNEEEHQDAFVITSSRLNTASDIRIFNSQTTDAVEDRVRIETAFYYAEMKAGINSSVLKYLPAIPGHPGYRFQRSTQACAYDDAGKYNCQKMASICKDGSGECQTIPEPQDIDLSQVRMTGKTVPYLQSNVSGALLWPDLEDHPLDGQLPKWIGAHMFGCQ